MQKKKPKDSPLPVSPASLCSPIKDSPLSLGPSRKSHPKPKNKAREVGEIIAPQLARVWSDNPDGVKPQQHFY